MACVISLSRARMRATGPGSAARRRYRRCSTAGGKIPPHPPTLHPPHPTAHLPLPSPPPHPPTPQPTVSTPAPITPTYRSPTHPPTQHARLPLPHPLSHPTRPLTVAFHCMASPLSQPPTALRGARPQVRTHTHAQVRTPRRIKRFPRLANNFLRFWPAFCKQILRNKFYGQILRKKQPADNTLQPVLGIGVCSRRR